MLRVHYSSFLFLALLGGGDDTWKVNLLSLNLPNIQEISLKNLYSAVRARLDSSCVEVQVISCAAYDSVYGVSKFFEMACFLELKSCNSNVRSLEN